MCRAAHARSLVFDVDEHVAGMRIDGGDGGRRVGVVFGVARAYSLL